MLLGASGEPVGHYARKLSSIPPDEPPLSELTIIQPQRFIVAYHLHPHTLTYSKCDQQSGEPAGVSLSAPSDSGSTSTCDWPRCNGYARSEHHYLCAVDSFHVCLGCSQLIENDALEKRERSRLKKDATPVKYIQPRPWWEQQVVVSFSGGGIRSASFCSGALQWFTFTTGAAPRTISSVSGGGYLAGAFIHWARAHQLGDVPLTHWVNSFFEHFGDSVGYLVRDCSRSCTGSCGDCFTLLLCILLMALTTLLLGGPAMASYAIMLEPALCDVVHTDKSLTDVSTYFVGFFSAALLLRFTPLACQVVLGIPFRSFVKRLRQSYPERMKRLTAWHRSNYDNNWRRLDSLFRVLLAILVLVSVLLAMSKFPLLPFFGWWVAVLVSSLGFVKTSNRVGWLILLLAVWQVYWYSTMLTWYCNKGSRLAIKVPILGYELLYRPREGRDFFATWELWDGDWFAGEFVMQLALMCSFLNQFIITFRDMIVPLFYKDALTKAFFYQPARCHCRARGKCKVYRNPKLNKAVTTWYNKYQGIPYLDRVFRFTYEYGALATIWEGLLWLRRRLWRRLRSSFKQLVVAVCERFGSTSPFKESISDEQKRVRWESWCKHKLTLMQSWDVNLTPSTSLPSLPQWICVTTLNEHSQYRHSAIFDQFLLLTSKQRVIPNGETATIGCSLSTFSNAARLWEKARAEHKQYETLLQKIMGPAAGDRGARLLAPKHNQDDPASLTAEIGLNDATALSGAAISFEMGRFTHNASVIQGVRGLHSLFGLSMSKQVLARPFWEILTERNGFTPQALNVVHMALLAAMAYFLPSHDRGWLQYLSWALGVVSALQVVMITCWPSDGVELVPMYRAVRLLLGLPRIAGPNDTAVHQLNLTDGGHSENFGILPLLSREAEIIVMCDGSADPGQRMEELYNVLVSCRQVWGIRFQVLPAGLDTLQLRPDYDDWNLKVDLTAWGLSGSKGHFRQHVLRIFVTYPSGKSGLLLYLKPREWEVDTHSTRQLHGCCCGCCHRRWICGYLGCPGRFPHHSTVNQFFTREMYDAYNTEGQEAFLEASEWLHVWQEMQRRRTLLDGLKVQATHWFGGGGTERNDLDRVDPMARLSELSLHFVDKPGQAFYICGITARYEKDGQQSGPLCKHGICTEEKLTESRLEGTLSVQSRQLSGNEYFSTIEVKSRTRIDDLRFVGPHGDLSRSLGFCQDTLSTRPAYFDVTALEHSVLTVPGFRLYRLHSRKLKSGAHPILGLRFILAPATTAEQAWAYGPAAPPPPPPLSPPSATLSPPPPIVHNIRRRSIRLTDQNRAAR